MYAVISRSHDRAANKPTLFYNAYTVKVVMHYNAVIEALVSLFLVTRLFQIYLRW